MIKKKVLYKINFKAKSLLFCSNQRKDRSTLSTQKRDHKPENFSKNFSFWWVAKKITKISKNKTHQFKYHKIYFPNFLEM